MIAPHANPHLFGHERAEATFVRALERDRLAHAWLLRGPAGVGKATLAYRFARRLLAGSEHVQAASDPGHPVFRMVANRAHPDLKVLERIPNPKTGKLYREILVDQVRAVDEGLHETAARAGYKVLVVDAADELGSAGANALLKLLEEPPSRTVLLLVCQRPGILPRTILSRCTQLPMAPLARAELEAALAQLAPEMTPPQRAALADLADGSPGRAIELQDSGWLARYATLLPKLADARTAMHLRLDLASELAKGGEGRGVRTAADLLGTVIRRAAALKAGKTPARELFAGEEAQLARLADGLALDQWVGVWDKLAPLAGQVERLNLDPAQALLQVLQAICAAAPEPELSLA
ncbi:MAG: DNA polymerase III subunit delta' [Geminicoccaceae bacterium]